LFSVGVPAAAAPAADRKRDHDDQYNGTSDGTEDVTGGVALLVPVMPRLGSLRRI
jgi:hypothetical protein